MLSEIRKQAIERQAADVRADYEISELRLDPMALASLAGIEVAAKPDNNPGISGALIRQGDEYGILYATHISNVGFQRFSVAHELGHYFLPGHVENVLSTGIHQSQAGYGAADQYEREADHFAACLMMPKLLFSRQMSRHSDGLGAAKGLAEQCGTSLTATAIRYAELTDSPVAVILSEGSQVFASFISTPMFDLVRCRLKKGSQLPSRSLTAAFNQGSRVSGVEDAREIDLQEWFGMDRQVRGVEEVICLGEYGRNLTILSTDIMPDEEDEDEDEEWEPPKFR